MSLLPPPDEMVRLDGKAAVVTGGAGGIGRGIVRRLAQAGARVVVHHHSSATAAKELAAEIEEEGGAAVTVQADLTSPDGPTQATQAAVEAFGRLDVLVNNAAIQPLANLATLPDDEWRQMLEVNLTAVQRCTQAAAAVMSSGGSGGAIIHIASIEASHPAPSHGHYAVAKAGVVMHARAAAQELGRAGIRVNVVSPGLIHRPGIEEQWPEGVERWQTAAPLTRLGTPEDIGDACVFLASDLARWVTGSELVVDGGVSARPTW